MNLSRRLLVVFIGVISFVRLQASDEAVRQKTISPIFVCGYAPVIFYEYVTDNPSQRQCDNSPRKYKPKHHGLGFEILDSESQACSVPDQEYELLDKIVDAVVNRIKYDNTITDAAAKREQAKQISRVTSQVLKDFGFEIHIPTATLSDALFNRHTSGIQPQQLMDCDTGSFIYLTVAENLEAPMSLVDITIDEDVGHNYVRWDLGLNETLDWDTNSASECQTPNKLPPYQGRSMTRTETLGYALTLRAYMWKTQGNYDRAAIDYHSAITLYPQSPTAYNNFAWMIATNDFAQRKNWIKEAVVDAEKALAIDRTANYLDTAACAYALAGNFELARKLEDEAHELQPGNADFGARLFQFDPAVKKDCTGAK